MGVGQWLAATGAVLLAVLLGGLLFALVSLVATVRSLRVTVERLREETLEITRHMQDALLDAQNQDPTRVPGAVAGSTAHHGS